MFDILHNNYWNPPENGDEPQPFQRIRYYLYKVKGKNIIITFIDETDWEIYNIKFEIKKEKKKKCKNPHKKMFWYNKLNLKKLL